MDDNQTPTAQHTAIVIEIVVSKVSLSEKRLLAISRPMAAFANTCQIQEHIPIRINYLSGGECFETAGCLRWRVDLLEHQLLSWLRSKLFPLPGQLATHENRRKAPNPGKHLLRLPRLRLLAGIVNFDDFSPKKLVMDLPSETGVPCVLQLTLIVLPPIPLSAAGLFGKWPVYWRDLPEAVKECEECVALAIRKDWLNFQDAPEYFRMRKGLVRKWVLKCYDNFRHLHETLKHDKEFVIELLEQLECDSTAFELFKLLPAIARHDCEVAMVAVKRHPFCFSYTSAAVRGVKGVAMAAVGQMGVLLAHTSEELQADEEVVRLAVQNAGKDNVLQYASADLQALLQESQ